MPALKSILILIAFCFLISFVFSCRSDLSKKVHDSTTPVCDKHLFVETFTIFGSGAYGEDRVSEYLTDSTNFRIYVGTFDNGHEGYSYQCYGDSIRISKVVDDTAGKRKIVSLNIFRVSDLKKSKKFD